ncbi:hypothetical protein EK21DRAFT_84915 [Setomelanomma holmii]|uniref:Uncharacterized protein n=1 Tax=Setomelanomma holmii TaxID=210430 RepID=A0A9P4HKQ0_9PLEO|nr:hypothetical protein EK21DRAFT_84915 [Setomelanomma holmii]
MPLFEAFISKLAAFRDANTTTFNANASFNAYSNTTGGMSSYIGLTYSNNTIYDQYRLLAQPLKQQYQAKFGRTPYWNPQTRVRWQCSATLSFSSYHNATQRYQTFQAWFRSKLTPTCESSLCPLAIGRTTREWLSAMSLPVTIDIVAAAGCDQMLMDLVAELADEGIVPLEVKTGRSIF